MTTKISKFSKKLTEEIERLSKGNKKAKSILNGYVSVGNVDLKPLEQYEIYGEDIVKLYEDGSQANPDVLREVVFCLKNGAYTREEVDRFLNRK